MWDKQRECRAIEENSFAMFHLLELYKRRGCNVSELDFSRQDLRFVSLQNRAGDYSNVNFRGAMIGRKTLLPQGHNGTIASVAWVTESDKNTCDLFFTAGMELCLWNIRYGGMVKKWIPHTSGITCVAVDPNGIKYATVSHDKTVALGSLKPLSDPSVIYSHHEELTSVVFLLNDKFLIVSDECNHLIVLDYDGNCLVEFDYCQGIAGEINSLKCDSNGRFFALMGIVN